MTGPGCGDRNSGYKPLGKSEQEGHPRGREGSTGAEEEARQEAEGTEQEERRVS